MKIYKNFTFNRDFQVRVRICERNMVITWKFRENWTRPTNFQRSSRTPWHPLHHCPCVRQRALQPFQEVEATNASVIVSQAQIYLLQEAPLKSDKPQTLWRLDFIKNKDFP